MGMALYGIAGLANLAAFVYVLIRLFKEEGAGKGVLGLFCGIYTYWWGWKNATRLDMQDAQNNTKGLMPIKTAMIVWTAAWIASIIVSRVAA